MSRDKVAPEIQPLFDLSLRQSADVSRRVVFAALAFVVLLFLSPATFADDNAKDLFPTCKMGCSKKEGACGNGCCKCSSGSVPEKARPAENSECRSAKEWIKEHSKANSDKDVAEMDCRHAKTVAGNRGWKTQEELKRDADDEQAKQIREEVAAAWKAIAADREALKTGNATTEGIKDAITALKARADALRKNWSRFRDTNDDSSASATSSLESVVHARIDQLQTALYDAQRRDLVAAVDKLNTDLNRDANSRGNRPAPAEPVAPTAETSKAKNDSLANEILKQTKSINDASDAGVLPKIPKSTNPGLGDPQNIPAPLMDNQLRDLVQQAINQSPAPHSARADNTPPPIDRFDSATSTKEPPPAPDRNITRFDKSSETPSAPPAPVARDGQHSAVASNTGERPSGIGRFDPPQSPDANKSATPSPSISDARRTDDQTLSARRTAGPLKDGETSGPIPPQTPHLDGSALPPGNVVHYVNGVQNTPQEALQDAQKLADQTGNTAQLRYWEADSTTLQDAARAGFALVSRAAGNTFNTVAHGIHEDVKQTVEAGQPYYLVAHSAGSIDTKNAVVRYANELAADPNLSDVQRQQRLDQIHIIVVGSATPESGWPKVGSVYQVYHEDDGISRNTGPGPFINVHGGGVGIDQHNAGNVYIPQINADMFSSSGTMVIHRDGSRVVHK